MVGDREAILARLKRDLELGANKEFVSYEESESESEEEELEPYQTFPMLESPVIKQHGDLTCGMRCLQNMYGAHIVTREEMDSRSKKMEEKSFGVPMFNPLYGDYSVEVLKDVLHSKGKWAQRIDIQKIPSGYFIPVLEANPTFVGYIVAFDGHYVTVKYSKDVYRCIDSLENVATRMINRESLFKARPGIFCSQDSDDTREVIALLAVGGSPFVEYSLMHDTWTNIPPSVAKYTDVIHRVLNPRIKKVLKRAAGNTEVLQWYQQWKNVRKAPSENCLKYLTSFLSATISDEKTIIVHMDEHQTAIRCNSMQRLIGELAEMQWITPGTDFFFQTPSKTLVDEDGNEPDFDSEGTLADYGILDGTQITLLTRASLPNQANVGGFYTFRCVVEGTCIGQQHNAYSVRDEKGKVHVIYKQCIETITQ